MSPRRSRGRRHPPGEGCMSTLQVACKGDPAIEEGGLGPLGIPWLFDDYSSRYGGPLDSLTQESYPSSTRVTEAKRPSGMNCHHLSGPSGQG